MNVPNTTTVATETHSRATDCLLETCETIAHQQIPNLLRVFLNPWVAQTCLCLDTFARRFAGDVSGTDAFPSFLANSREEALSGAIKLARYTLNTQPPSARSPHVLIIDPQGVFRHLGGAVPGQPERPQTLPAVDCCNEAEAGKWLQHSTCETGIVVLADTTTDITLIPGLHDLLARPDTITIQCVTSSDDAARTPADIVVFDESFVDHAVAFAAFTARAALFEPWMSGGMAMFHSTTFQPNTLTTMHFMKCCRAHGLVPEHLTPALDELLHSVEARHAVYRRLYSPSLSRLIATIRFDQAEPRAEAHFVTVGDRRVLDLVAGVACSLRGHNPRGIAAEVRSTLADVGDVSARVSGLFEQLSGLPHYLPAVSGGSANELALKTALSIRPEHPHVLALQGGFGGKTLTALTGTARQSYKTGIGPLYPHVTYVDPFAADAVAQLATAFEQNSVGVVQLELIQGVGGVRPIPQRVLDALAAEHQRRGFVLLVDEVQTGMFRTGPFLRSQQVGITPDIVTLAKGTSDMMFPSAAVLLSDAVHTALLAANPDLAADARERFAYPAACAALHNSLTRAVSEDWAKRVRHQAVVLRRALSGLADCPHVVEIRVFGMLIGIEINNRRGIPRLLGRHAARVYALALLQDRKLPVLAGFCQYEPHVLKLTPGLLMNGDEIAMAADTILRVLRRHPIRVVFHAVRTLLWHRLRFASRRSPHEPVPHQL